MTWKDMPDTADYPIPTGYRILIRLPEVKTKIGSIVLPEKTQDPQRHLAQMGEVVALGPEAYAEKRPWCRIGDTIMFSKYAGTRMMVRDREIRLINDDEVQAVVPNPDIIKPASGPLV